MKVSPANKKLYYVLFCYILRTNYRHIEIKKVLGGQGVYQKNWPILLAD